MTSAAKIAGRHRVVVVVASVLGAAGWVNSPASSADSPHTPLIDEIQRELGAARITHYQHHTEVDEATGRFEYDCSGLLDYALGRANPDALHALPHNGSARPLAADVERYLQRGLTAPINGWHSLARVDELRPGDVIAWRATEDSTTGDTGHVMVALSPASGNPDRPHEWLIDVADSTLSPHARDSRHDAQTGLGTGTIGVVVNDRGTADAFYWRGGLSDRARPTEIALGRPV